jgi:hypothetical protein
VNVRFAFHAALDGSSKAPATITFITPKATPAKK